MPSTPPRSEKKGGRWGRSSRKKSEYSNNTAEEADADDFYVPPKTSGLTGGLTSLFRQKEKTPNGSSSAGTKQRNSKSPARRRSSNPEASSPPRTSTVGSSGDGTSTPSRIFYSSNGDDSDDSYESRAAASQSGKGGDRESTISDGATEATASSFGGNTIRTILRYRGFSTSIQALFLDEALVCASMGCFGLFLSNRTEHLLQLRNDRRGVRWGRSTSRRTLPSRLVAYALLLTLFLIAITFCIWGFGNGEVSGFAEGFYGGYDGATWDDAVENGGQDGYYVAQDDQAGNDDRNNQQNDDQYNNYQGDDANNNVNGDDANQAGDDGYNNNYNYGDDNANNNENGDDAFNGDDANYDNGDDANNNVDDANYNGADDYYNNNGRERLLDGSSLRSTERSSHRTNGICKIRDMNEALWVPTVDFIKQEWNAGWEQLDSRHLEEYDESSQEKHSAGRDLAADIRISLIFAFLIVLGILGRRRRMRTRYYIVRARAQEDHLFYASSAAGVKRVAFQDSREDQYEGACSHTLCGWYPTDPPHDGDEIDDEVKVGDDGVTQRKKIHYNRDCVSRGFSCLTGFCCGCLCKCWCQCLSICALAQEAREVRLLVPTRYQRIDYITHQPFHEYQKDVNDLRRGWLGKTRKKSGIMPHLKALSRLSRYILGLFSGVILALTATLLFNPRASFSWPDAVILAATFVQSFFVLYFVHWLFHKSDLSLDAVVKFFAAGFLIAVPSAFFFEGMMVNILLSMAYAIYPIGELIKGESFATWFAGHYRLIWIVGELVNAYIVAAVTEELCKYYTFRCVEHPDLIFLTGLARSSEDARTVAGGTVKYPFSSHQVQNTNKRGSYDDDDVSVHSRTSHRSISKRDETNEQLVADEKPPEEEFYEDEHDVRTYRQKAAAVTTGMISIAVGLACAENFLYVFLLGGTAANSGDVESGGIIEEWLVLLFRSLFPVHALAAAMQSVNMVRKFVECDDHNNHRIGVGRIIIPAAILHGTFDAILLGINVYIETAWEKYLDDNNGNIDPDNPPYNALVVNIVAWFSIITVMILGIGWYVRENRAQRQRLIILEEKLKAETDSHHNYTNPSETSSPSQRMSEVELV